MTQRKRKYAMAVDVGLVISMERGIEENLRHHWT